jgi:hypothetical protein
MKKYVVEADYFSDHSVLQEDLDQFDSEKPYIERAIRMAIRNGIPPRMGESVMGSNDVYYIADITFYGNVSIGPRGTWYPETAKTMYWVHRSDYYSNVRTEDGVE